MLRSVIARRIGQGTAAMLLYAAGGCADAPVGPAGPVPLVVDVAGRVERGLVVSLSARRVNETEPVTGVVWAVEPDGAAELLPGDRVRLLREGSVTLGATHGASSGEATLTVALPPLVVFEVMGGTAPRTLYRARLDGAELTALPVGPGETRDATTAAGSLVFVGYRDGNGELYRLAAGGTVPQRLTTTAAAEAQPALSPDGTKLAFTRAVGGAPKLFLARADATDAVRAAPLHGYGSAIEATPAWSPAGDRVVFMSTASGRPGLYLLTPASGQVEPLIVNGRSNVEPAWSPDGRYVAWAVIEAGQADVYMMNLETRAETRLTNRPGSDGRPMWLPDGRLVYTSWAGAVPGLRWLDPAEPDLVFDVPLAVPGAAGAAAVR